MDSFICPIVGSGYYPLIDALELRTNGFGSDLISLQSEIAKTIIVLVPPIVEYDLLSADWQDAGNLVTQYLYFQQLESSDYKYDSTSITPDF